MCKKFFIFHRSIDRLPRRRKVANKKSQELGGTGPEKFIISTCTYMMYSNMFSFFYNYSPFKLIFVVIFCWLQIVFFFIFGLFNHHYYFNLTSYIQKRAVHNKKKVRANRKKITEIFSQSQFVQEREREREIKI